MEDIEEDYDIEDEDFEDEGDWGSDADLEENSDGDLDVSIRAAVANELPDETIERVEIDIDELTLLPRFISNFNAKDNGGLVVRVGFRLKKIGLNDDQIDAWGVTDKNLIVVNLDFGPNYLRQFYAPTFSVSAVRSMSECDEMKSESDFHLGWVLGNRIQNSFFRLWPPQKHELEPAVNFRDVQQIMDTSSADYLTCVAAYKNTNKNISDAILIATDEAKAQEVLRQKQEQGAADKNLQSLSVRGSKFIENDEEDKFCPSDHLSDAFSVHPDVVALAIQRAGARKTAQELLLNPLSRQELIDEVNIIHRDKYIIEALLEHNVLCQLAIFVEKTLQTINKCCVVCKKLQFVGWKVTDSDRAEKEGFCKCPFQGVGFGLMRGLRAHPETVELLISMTAAAVGANRIDNCYPSEVNADGDSFIKVNGDLDTDRLNKCFGKCPSVKEMTESHARGSLQHDLVSRDVLLYGLLQWILSSSQARIRRLKPSDCLEQMTADMQFMFVSSAPGKEDEFQKLKAEAEKLNGPGKGSRFAWHGSPLGNWNSIIREGLKNMSGTKKQLHGAAHGAGIYLAKRTTHSMGYCGAGYGRGAAWSNSWKNSSLGTNVQVLALVEIVNHKNLKDQGWGYVIPNESWVATRFLFVYKQGKGSSQPDVNSDTIQIPSHLLMGPDAA